MLFAFSRLLWLVATLFAASLLIFLAMQVLPGDPAAVLLGINASPEALAALRAEMGLDRPLAVQFFAFAGGVLTGDLGRSATYDVPVAALIAERAAVSVPLALIAVLISVAISLPAGVWAATNRGNWRDRVVGAGAQIGLSIPNIWLGLMLIVVFAIVLGVAPAGGFPGWDNGPGPALTALCLPAIALAAPQAAILTRIVRAAVVEAMDQDYVALARAKGLSHAKAVRRHALRNAWAPILTIIGLQFGFLAAGAIVIETVFSLPGLGRLLFQAVAQRDVPVVQGVVLVVVAAVVLVNALCDALAAWCDPRRRTNADGLFA
ncbi:ABC transporter permease [Acuticoccus sp. MNP-M23]|uniref:ABC transporter permease n=1 Tax=Acuticoccus sp. MNP-M23 TaxID=3072793 RepID=UPI0028161F10|nr:ABC transporter permease [Acuticoccus sp. MNP-M23]WMS40805.1 ABC transporter permease [Acuticoccus sp. MNP-M23]